MPVWQQQFEKYKDKNFTVVGIALDVEGIPPAKLYYDEHKVTFPSLVDPNYATQFGAVPKTFFVNEHGVVQPLKGWEQKLDEPLEPVTDEVRKQWAQPLEGEITGRFVEYSGSASLRATTELASRYLALNLHEEAARVLKPAVMSEDSRWVATTGSKAQAKLLSQAYLQLARAHKNDRELQVKYATKSYYINPSVGFAKQIARLIEPEKFDHRPRGDFDNRFREATKRRLEKERAAWLKGESK